MGQYTIPTVVERTSRGERAFDIYSRLLSERIIFLGTEITDDVANVIIAQLLHLQHESAELDVEFYINSRGGSYSALTAIYDTMRLIPNDVSTLAMGFAASMGQFLLCGGTPGKRYALPNARIMMHQGSAGIGGTTADILIQAENLDHSKQTMERLLAENTGQTPETIARDGDRDRWFTAEEAREYGMVDRVVESLADVRPAASKRRMGL